MKGCFALTSLIALALLPFLATTGCHKEQPPLAEPKPSIRAAAPSAEGTSFAQVTSKLDAGGDLYLYLSTEQWLAGISEKLATWHGLLGAIPNPQDQGRQHLDTLIGIATNFIQQSGLEEISALGLSSVARETNLYHTKLFLCRSPGKPSGLIWNVLGQKPHELDGLNLLPATTALAVITDLDGPLLSLALQKQVAQSRLPQAEDLLHKFFESFEQTTGLKWDQVLASLGDQVGFALMLDDSRVIPIPVPGETDPVQVPEPTLLMIAKVKDETIYNRIDTVLRQNVGQMVIKTDKPGLKMRTWPLPLPLALQLRPTVAAVDGYLFIASNDAIIQEVLAVKAGQKPGLKSTEEFQRLSKDIPAQGNCFSFTSRRFGQTMFKVIEKALARSAGALEPQAPWQQTILSAHMPAASYVVAGNTEDGWLVVANGNQHAAKLLAAGAAVPLGLLAATVAPYAVKGKAAAQPGH